jgi:hypothetical protein
LSTLHLLVFRAFCQSVVAIYGHRLCPPLLSTTSVLLWPKQSYCVSCFLGSHYLAFLSPNPIRLMPNHT